MHRAMVRACVGGGLLLGGLLGVASCSSTSHGESTATVAVAPSILAPRDVLDGAALVSVYVFDVSGDLACDSATGMVTSGGQRVDVKTASSQTNLGTSGCVVPGAKFCGNLTLTQSSTDRLFQVIAYGAGATELGDGCTRAKIDGDMTALPLIQVVRFVTPAVCGDGKVESTEQCEKGVAADGAVCDSSCHSVEQLLSTGLDTSDQTMTSDAKSDPTFLWPAASDDSGHFLSFFTDHPAGHEQVGVRVFSEVFAPVTDEGAVTQKGYVWLPNDSMGDFPPGETSGNQSLPAATFVSNRYYVAFADDANLGSGDGSPDIHVRTMDVTLSADQAAGAPLGINGASGMGEANPQTSPAVALGTNGQVLVAWTDQSTGSIAARTLGTDTAHTLGTQTTISSGTQNDGVSLAAVPGGFVAAWISGGNAVVRTLSADGAPIGSVVQVTTAGHASHARVASLPDGRVAVAYASSGGANGVDVFVQRYTAAMVAIAGDSSSPVNDATVAGDQTAPVIAALSSSSGSFAAAWVDGPSGSIHARYVGGSSGYLFNNVDGQSGEFTASLATGRQRDQPSIAVGGAGPYVAIGWRDSGPGGTSGIYARRFPIPQ